VKTQIQIQTPKTQVPPKIDQERLKLIFKAIAYAEIRHLVKRKDILAVDLDKSFGDYYVDIYLKNSNLKIVVKINEKSELMESWIQPVMCGD